MEGQPHTKPTEACAAAVDAADDSDLVPVGPGTVVPAQPVPAEVNEAPASAGPQTAAPEERPAISRLHSLDALRGITVLLMLLVNNASLDTLTPTQLTHAGWKGGIHLADLVFPWFLFCVGVALPYSAASFRRKGLPSWRYDVKLLLRALWLFLLGCLIASSIQRRPVLELGVLQLIALAGLSAGLVAELPVSRRLLLSAAILIGYGAALVYIPIPVYGRGLSGERENLIASLNALYLTPAGLRGLPSVVPTTALVLLGTVAGSILAREKSPNLAAAARLLLYGLVMAALGALWNVRLPYSKALWTPSYILFSGGIGAFALSILYVIIDGPGWQTWFTPLLAAGANAIAAYVGAILLKVWVLQSWRIGGEGASSTMSDWYLAYLVGRYGRWTGGWLHTLTFVGMCWAILLVLYRKRIFLRV